MTPYSNGSDHDDYDSSTIAVPSLYLRDWPDIYIHTDHDSLDQIDATKLRRVALLGPLLDMSMPALQRPNFTRYCHFSRRRLRLASLRLLQRRSSWWTIPDLRRASPGTKRAI